MAKKDKKKAKQQDDYWDTEFQEDAAAINATSNQEPQTTTEVAKDSVTDDLGDDFGGLMAAIKKVKGKKGKKQQVEMVDANEELEALDETAPEKADGDAAAVDDAEKDVEESGEFRVKTKKEKEKEKKEREKAKKKAQVPFSRDNVYIYS